MEQIEIEGHKMHKTFECAQVNPSALTFTQVLQVLDVQENSFERQLLDGARKAVLQTPLYDVVQVESTC